VHVSCFVWLPYGVINDDDNMTDEHNDEHNSLWHANVQKKLITLNTVYEKIIFLCGHYDKFCKMTHFKQNIVLFNCKLLSTFCSVFELLSS